MSTAGRVVAGAVEECGGGGSVFAIGGSKRSELSFRPSPLVTAAGNLCPSVTMFVV